jgi:Family of unknown function (DUF6790)
MITLIQLALDDFPITLVLLGLLTAAISLAATHRERTAERVASTLLRWYLLYAVGLTFLVRFVLLAWFGDVTPHLHGASPDGLQHQVTAAYLGFALIGFLGVFGGLGLRLAAVVGSAAFLWGGALGLMLSTQRAGAFQPVGAIRYADLLVPLIGFGLLAWQAKAQSRRSVFARSRL